MSASRSRLANAAHHAMLQRTELQRSLGLTTSAFKPSALKDRGKFHVKTSAQDVAAIAKDELRRKRFYFGLAAVAGAVFVLRKPLQEKGPNWAKSAGHHVKKFAASINRSLDPGAKDSDYAGLEDPIKATESKRQKARNALKKLWPTAALAGATLEEKVDVDMNSLSQTAQDARDKASNLAEKAADSARQTAEAAKARVQDGYGRAREAGADLAVKGRETAEHAKDAASAAYSKGKEKAKVATSRLQEFADDQPLTLIAGAVAAGLLIGTLFAGKSEDDAE